MTDATCTVRCYGCDWTTTVIGMEAAQDAMSDHYKAKHWTPHQDRTTTLTLDPVMREDMVRVGMGTADIRYRAEYRDWSAILRIQFVPNLIDLDSVVALVDAGGTNGIGEWRPEKNGSFGTYEVVSEELE